LAFFLPLDLNRNICSSGVSNLPTFRLELYYWLCWLSTFLTL
jgi:hypothetical protein